jgi:hypothetical protein
VIGFLEDVKILLTVSFTIQELILLINESENFYLEKKVLVMEKIQHIQELEAKLETSKKFLVDVLEGKASFQTPCRSMDSTV